jgi:hypothetical protein
MDAEKSAFTQNCPCKWNQQDKSLCVVVSITIVIVVQDSEVATPERKGIIYRMQIIFSKQNIAKWICLLWVGTRVKF